MHSQPGVLCRCGSIFRINISSPWSRIQAQVQRTFLFPPVHSRHCIWLVLVRCKERGALGDKGLVLHSSYGDGGDLALVFYQCVGSFLWEGALACVLQDSNWGSLKQVLCPPWKGMSVPGRLYLWVPRMRISLVLQLLDSGGDRLDPS